MPVGSRRQSAQTNPVVLSERDKKRRGVEAKTDAPVLSLTEICYSTAMNDVYFNAADPAHIRREKQKARELRQSQWWKRKRSTGICYYCRGKFPPDELTMDHLVPLARGGRTTKGNVVPCCKECNSRKNYLLPIEWQEYLEKIRNETE
jgi:5-methylcytosine-specific restriction enzyme A